MMDRNELLNRLGNVHEFLQAIDDPGADAVAIAAAILSGAATFQGGARLLSLEEVRDWKGFLWVEICPAYTGDFQGRLMKAAMVRDEGDGVLTFQLREIPNFHKVSVVYYGEAVRCWASKPTAEDQAAAEWEVDENG